MPLSLFSLGLSAYLPKSLFLSLSIRWAAARGGGGLAAARGGSVVEEEDDAGSGSSDGEARGDFSTRRRSEVDLAADPPSPSPSSLSPSPLSSPSPATITPSPSLRFRARTAVKAVAGLCSGGGEAEAGRAR